MAQELFFIISAAAADIWRNRDLLKAMNGKVPRLVGV